MAVTIPNTAILQPSDSIKSGTNDIRSFDLSWKGPYDDLKNADDAIQQGDIYDGKTVAAHELVRISSNWGLLTLHLTDTSATVSSELQPLVEKWSIKACRNDVSILGYCGPENSNPSRPWIECWQRSADANSAYEGNYVKPDGSIADLSLEDHCAATSELIAKIKKGVESVIRFYPMVIRRRIYSAMPPTCLENLGYIDTPSIGSGARNPGNLASKISEYQWLKVDDTSEQTSASEWQRVEAWMGIKKASGNDSPWDPDLYGPNRWPMPYNQAGSNGGS